MNFRNHSDQARLMALYVVCGAPTSCRAESRTSEYDHQMDLTSLILACPRGRYFCASIAHLRHAGSEKLARGGLATVEETQEIIRATNVTATPLSANELLSTLSHTTSSAQYWDVPDHDDLVLADPDVTSLLRPVADEILASPLTQWWGDPVDLDKQHTVQHLQPDSQQTHAREPRLTQSTNLDAWFKHVTQREAGAGRYREEHPNAHIGGDWWSIPTPSNALLTTRSITGLGALELVLKEDPIHSDIARVWAVQIRDTPRIYEITTPADWVRLVASFPLEVTHTKRDLWGDSTGIQRRWFIPNWAEVANKYDGVHLSLIGYLSTAGIGLTLPFDSSCATVLAGWDPDGTWWLNREAVRIDDQSSLWRQLDAQQWSPDPGSGEYPVIE